MDAQAPDSTPVTVVVTRRVKEGHQDAYEAWLRALLDEAKSLPGYLGTEILRPVGASREYTSVFRFASVAHLRAFEASELRRRALASVVPHVEGDPAWRELTGLELFFEPPPGTVVPQPSRFRMALVLVVVVYLLVLSIGSAVAFLLADLPAQARLLLTIALEVFLLTYVLMPRLTRWLARWIYPRTVVR
ncbi:MAG: antibiotic biosynthesis monooxygenase [Sandaracinus sp.]|nr:antibiotic biosynthesis monooxygenase [Sandaracinus sp.]MCB9611197.1 antibiotic biosynthesis monooxygenase [Sandaracinus sp.]MCB9621051.1 antibiotic biosynthesis monooxygenase [Sandaracinus sp.]MCB9630877.1 antibiotic biosynthesis monooxygenase [Sandaracinus sp.]